METGETDHLLYHQNVVELTTSPRIAFDHENERTSAFLWVDYLKAIIGLRLYQPSCGHSIDGCCWSRAKRSIPYECKRSASFLLIGAFRQVLPTVFHAFPTIMSHLHDFGFVSLIFTPCSSIANLGNGPYL